jgi:hypothetical protein
MVGRKEMTMNTTEVALVGLGAAAYWLWERRKTWAAVMAGSIVVGATLGIADAQAGLPFRTAEILLGELQGPRRAQAIAYAMGASDVGQDRIHCAPDDFDGTVFVPELEKALAVAPSERAAGLVVLAVMAKLHPCGKQEGL